MRYAECTVRFGNEAGDDRTKEKIDKRKYGFMNDDSDEEDEGDDDDFDGEDEDSIAAAEYSSDEEERFFSDLNNNIGADVGRLMRFLTKVRDFVYIYLFVLLYGS